MNYGYCRCSTNESKQDVNRQIKDVMFLGADADYIYTEYESGTKRNRVQLNKMLEDIQEGDSLFVTELSRISRSMADLLDILSILKDKKVRVVLGAFVLDFRNGDVDPMVMGMVNMMGVFSQMEREMTVQRIKSGLENTKAKGTKLGRRCTEIKDIPTQFLKYYKMYKRGAINVSELTRLAELGSRSSTYKYIRILEESEKKGV